MDEWEIDDVYDEDVSEQEREHQRVLEIFDYEIAKNQRQIEMWQESVGSHSEPDSNLPGLIEDANRRIAVLTAQRLEVDELETRSREEET